MHVSGLFIYPVKSLRGLSVSEIDIDALGFVGDRRFMVVDNTGRFVTQRTCPRMALIDTALASDSLLLSFPGARQIEVSRQSDPFASLISVTVWSSIGLEAEDCGAPVATWLETVIGIKCRLVRAGARFQRPMTKP